MLAFVHMHKCAGTTVVRAAKKSGFKLPRRHRNGNLRTEADKNVRYAQLSRDEFDALMTGLREEGVDFFSIEFDLPPIGYFGEHGIELFTVLRDPLRRAISNFKYAKVRGNAPADQSFRDFMNKASVKDGPLSRTANYYTRKLCQLSSTDTMSDEHLEQALATLAQFRSVVILESGELESELNKLGMHKVKAVRVTTDLKGASVLRPEEIEVSGEDQGWFVERNQLDIRLIERLQATPAGSRPITGRRAP